MSQKDQISVGILRIAPFKDLEREPKPLGDTAERVAWLDHISTHNGWRVQTSYKDTWKSYLSRFPL